VLDFVERGENHPRTPAADDERCVDDDNRREGGKTEQERDGHRKHRASSFEAVGETGESRPMFP